MEATRRNLPAALGRGVLAATGWSLLGGGKLLSQETTRATTATGDSHYFFKNDIFETIFLASLGRAYHCGGNVGKVLYRTRQVKDGDFESAFLAFRGARG